MSNLYDPKPSHKFTFGLWTVGNRGAVTGGAMASATNRNSLTAFVGGSARLAFTQGAGSSYLTQARTINYTYAPLSRLTSALYTTGEVFTYTYDSVGNRVSEQTITATTTYTYDIANRLTSVKGVTYSWDNNGNLLSDGVTTYTYDSANRLTMASGGGTVSIYQYNGLGDRVSQTVNSVTTYYTLDLNAELTQVLADGTNTYLYGNDRVAQYTAGHFAYFLPDALGSVRQLADESGAVTLARRYEPYGEVMGNSGSGASAYGFTGEQQAGDLVYLRARYLSNYLKGAR